MDQTRRQFISRAAGLTSAAALSSSILAAGTMPARSDTPLLATDKNAWQKVAGFYDVKPGITNLENGYWGIMARPVLEAYLEKSAFINRENTWFARQGWAAETNAIRSRVADFLDVSTDEIMLTRGATETLQALIAGYNQFKPGDAVLYADLDYREMKTAMRWLEERRGVRVIKIDLPEPASHDAVIHAYERAFDANADIKLVLMTHLNNLTGAIHPIKAVAAMARARGADVILDAAHSLGHVDFDIRDLGCDFVGLNLHKWVGAPIGCGVMYIRENRITDIDTYFGTHKDSSSITHRMDTGTANFAATMTVPDAIAFHENITTYAKQHRLKYLRDSWVSEARTIRGIDILTTDDQREVCALTSFRLRGLTGTKDNDAIVKRLAEDYRIMSVRRTGPAGGDCVRITPSIYNSEADMKALTEALHELAKT